MNIAIDGHAGSGKSVIAKEIAKALDIKVFDTGALYRAVACEWDAKNLGEVTKAKIDRFVKKLTVSVKFINDNQHTFVNGTDYTLFLRLEKISVLSSKISPYVCVREKVRGIQRDFALHNDCVMEGRDIGSEILPNADFKFFITAPVEVRARRRFEQSLAKQPNVKYSEILKALKERDYDDENREVSPLKIVPDSIVINNENQTINETLNECLKYIKLGKNFSKQF